ncbi:MAG: four helix bundle protein [Patescibacteria group bacterium]
MAGQFVRYRFEELDVWHIGMQVVRETYRVTRLFPKTETFALTDQLRRAATSIVLNVAEDSGQPTKKGFAVYVHRSKSSTLECVACIKVALQENFVKVADTAPLEKLLEQEYFKLVALGKSMSSSS